jgi:hypothetical protein
MFVRARQAVNLRQEAEQMEMSADARVDQLERLVSSLRHDLRGAITPASLVAERLKQNTIQRFNGQETR